MAAIAGLRGSDTADWATDERPKNFREMILWRDPNGSAPLTALMSKMKKETTDDPEFAWYEEELTIVRLTLATITTTTFTTFTVSAGDATNLKAGDLLLVEEGTESSSYADEIVQVVSVSSTTTFIVTRSVAGTATAIAAGEFATLIGSAYGEGELSPDAVSRNPTKEYNYTQIFKDAYELTGTAEQTRYRTGDPIKNDKKRKMFDHATRQELAYLFGKRVESTTGGSTRSKPLRMTGGLLEKLATADSTYSHCLNIWTTAMTVDTFLDAVYPVFDYGTPSASTAGTERLCLAGNGALNALNKMAKDDGQIQYDGTVKFYGMELKRYVIPQGTLFIKSHPLMNVHSRYKNGMFIIDPSGLVFRPLRSRDTRMQDNIQANDADARKGQWITEAGVEFHHMATMSFQGNMTF